MKTAPESRKITSILKSLREESLLPRPDFQRRAVWTNKDKIKFIETILLGFPFPEIYVASGDVDTNTGDAVEVLVDGQQRVRTIEEYFRGVSPFARTQAIARYSTLSEDEKRAFLNYDVSVRNLGIIEEDDIRAVFQRMNATSYDLNDMERYNAVYLGEFKQFCESIAQNEFFADHRIFSLADIRRMKDVSFIASLTATMMSDYFHRDDEIEVYLERYNETFEDKEALQNRYEKTLDFIENMNLEKQSRAWKKADFYTLFIESDRAINRNEIAVDPTIIGPQIATFFEAVNAVREEEAAPTGTVGEYYRATLQSTNDRSARVRRGTEIRSIITSEE